jgi:hypothetical protein
MARNNILFAIIGLLFVALLLTTCFSPWTGGDLAVINLSGRQLARSAGQDDLNHTLILHSPGRTLEYQLRSAESSHVLVAPGTWHISVRSTDSDGGVSFLGEAQSGAGASSIPLGMVTIQAGRSYSFDIRMISAMEVSSWAALHSGINAANAPQDQIFVLSGSGGDWFQGGPIFQIDRNITLLAAENVTITKTDPDWSLFTVRDGATLTLAQSPFLPCVITAAAYP